MTETINTSITDFGSSTDVDTDCSPNTSQPPKTDEPASTYVDHGTLPYNVDDFIEELTVEDVNNVLQTFSDSSADSLLKLLQQVSIDDSILECIESISGLTVDRKEVATSAVDEICEYVGFDCVSVSVTEPENEYQSPMVSKSVDEIKLTKNTELNTKLLQYVLDTEGVNKKKQKERRKLWLQCTDADTIISFKRRHGNPDALGFVIPENIPATGNTDTANSVTEVTQIGENRAGDIHPDGEIMALQDFKELTEMQWEYVSYPTRKDGFESRFAPHTIEWVFEAERTPSERIKLLSSLFDMHDSRDKENSELAWVNEDMTIGITETDCDEEYSMQLSDYTVDTVKTALNSETDVVMSEFGSNPKITKHIKETYWRVIETISEKTGNKIVASEEKKPVVCDLPDNRLFIVATRNDE